MPPRQMCTAERVALRALSELDQLEDGYLLCMGSGDPEGVAMGLRMLGSHLLLTLKHLQVAMVITESEQRLSAVKADDRPA